MTQMIVSEAEVEEIYKTEKFRVHLEKEEIPAVNELRSKLKEINNLHCPLNDAFLIKFLRAKNNNVPKTVALVKNYYDLKYDNDSLSDISFSTIARLYDTKFLTVVKQRDQLKRKIIHIRFDLIDLKTFSMEDIQLSIFFLLEEMITSEETQKYGLVFILNQADLSLTKATTIAAHLTLKQIKRILKVFQGSFPAKIKHIIAIHTHFVLNSTFAVFKYFLNAKMRNRTFFTRSGPEFIHKYVHPDILPVLLGGTLGPEEAEDIELLNCTIQSENYIRGLQQNYGYTSKM